MTFVAELESFDARTREDFDALIERVREFLSDHRPEIDALQVSVLGWRGEEVPHNVSNRALATVASLRALNQAVAAGEDANRKLGDLPFPDAP